MYGIQVLTRNCCQRSTPFPASLCTSGSFQGHRLGIMSAIASKAPTGDGDEGCLRNLAQLSPVSCQLRTSTGPLTALSLQVTKKADPRARVTHSRSSWRSTAYGFGYSESQLLQDALNRGLHFWKNRNKFGTML